MQTWVLILLAWPHLPTLCKGPDIPHLASKVFGSLQTTWLIKRDDECVTSFEPESLAAATSGTRTWCWLFLRLIAGALGTLRVMSSCQTLGHGCSLTRVHYHLNAESLLRYRSSQIEASCVRAALSLHFQLWPVFCSTGGYGGVRGSLHTNHQTLAGFERGKWRRLFHLKRPAWGGSGNDLLTSALWTQTAKSAVVSSFVCMRPTLAVLFLSEKPARIVIFSLCIWTAGAVIKCWVIVEDSKSSSYRPATDAKVVLINVPPKAQQAFWHQWLNRPFGVTGQCLQNLQASRRKQERWDGESFQCLSKSKTLTSADTWQHTLSSHISIFASSHFYTFFSGL